MTLKLAAALAFLGLDFYTYHYLATNPVIPDRSSFSEFPDQLGDWICPNREIITDDVIQNLGVTDYLLCNYQHDKSHQSAGVYVGYHASQIREEGGGAGENSIHPPAHCLPGSGWDIIDHRTVELDIEGMPQAPALVKRLVVARGNQRQLTYYWYQSRGRVIAEDWKKIIFVGFDRAVRRRTDGSLIRFTIPIFRDDEETAEATFNNLVSEILPLIPPYVPE